MGIALHHQVDAADGHGSGVGQLLTGAAIKELPKPLITPSKGHLVAVLIHAGSDLVLHGIAHLQLEQALAQRSVPDGGDQGFLPLEVRLHKLIQHDGVAARGAGRGVVAGVGDVHRLLKWPR